MSHRGRQPETHDHRKLGLAVLTGTHPQAFPAVGDADRAWEWYAANNRYANQAPPEKRWILQDLMQISVRSFFTR